jgi:hypothetical protein
MGDKKSLGKKKTVNVHDLYDTGTLRTVSPEELVAALERRLQGRTVRAIGFCSGDSRMDRGNFTVDGFEVYYQVCGLFAGDEYLTFGKGTPKQMADEVMAVWQIAAAKRALEHLREFEEMSKEEGGPKVVTMDELSAGQSEEGRRIYAEKVCSEVEAAIDEAELVLGGRKSYLDGRLRGHRRSETLGEALNRMCMLQEAIDSTIKRELQSESEITVILAKSYLQWKLKVSGFETMYHSFRKKVKRTYEGLKTAPQRGWGPFLDHKYPLELEAYRRANEDPAVFDRAVEAGKSLLQKVREEHARIKKEHSAAKKKKLP